MEYQVPQFIEVEDKIFGPLTLKQFIYIAGGTGLVAILLLYLPFVIGLILALPVAGLALGLAFYKINGKPLIAIIEAGVAYYFRSRFYLWKKEMPSGPASPEARDTTLSVGAVPPRQKLEMTGSRLKEIALALDVENPTR